MDESNGAGDEPVPTGKLARLLDAYDLSDLGADLERRWTATGTERASIRDLVDLVNRRLLERTLCEEGARPLEGEVANLYRLLTDETVSGAERTRLRRRLERDGIDVDSLLDDFVSRQAVYTYLTSHRGVAYDPSSDRNWREDLETIGRLRSRLDTVVTDRVERLIAVEDIRITNPGVLIEVRVYCEHCGDEFGLTDLGTDVVCSCHD